MNYTKRDISAPKSIAIESDALGPLEAPPSQPRKWAISHRAIAALAMLCDALIIITTSILSGVVYHLETFGQLGDIDNLAGLRPWLRLCSSPWRKAATSTTCPNC